MVTICPKRFRQKLRAPLYHLNCILLATLRAIIPGVAAFKYTPFLLIALCLAEVASAQTLPKLSVRASESNVLEGQSTTLTFRLNRVTDSQLEYCFMAGGSIGNSLIWDFNPARPTNSGYTEITGYIEAGQRQDVVTIRTQDDGDDDIGTQQVLLQYSISDTYGELDCTQNYTIRNNQSGGTLGVYDAHDYYGSVEVAVSATSTSISEGGTAEFVLNRSGGLIDQGRLVVEADEVDMDVKFSIGETGYVFTSNFAPWRVQGDANYQEISTDPADGETATITMPAGATEVTLEVDTNNDSVPEIANTAISLTVLPGDKPYSISTSTASTAVEDIGDTPSVSIHGLVTDTQVSEAAGHLQFGLQHSISHAPVDLTLRLSTTGDFFGTTPSIQIGLYRSATQPFLQAVSVTPTVLPSGELEFTMPFEEFEADNATRMVRVVLVSDDADEANGSATLTIPAQQGAASVSSTVTVTDDDLPTVTMTAGSHRIDEDDNVVFTLTRDGNTAVALSIPQQYLTSSFTPSRTVQDAEYPIEFSAGSNTATFTVSAADDDIFYTARKLDVTLDPDASAEFRVPDPAPGGSTSDSGADFTRYQLNAVDNDKAKLTISAITGPVAESDQACFTIGVNSVEFHPTIAFIFDVEMTVTEEGSYLASTQDRSFRYGITQTGPIAGNDTDYDVCLTLDDDLVDEPDATVSVEVTGPSNAHVEPAANAKASQTVTDNDGPTLTASLSVAEVHEDSPTDLALHRAGLVDDPLTIQAGDLKIEYVYPPEASELPVTLFENAVTFTANSDTAFSRILLPLDHFYNPGRQLQVTVSANGASYRVPSTPPANSVADLSDAAMTVYRYPIVEDDRGSLRIRAVTAEIDESQQACYRLTLRNGYIVSPFTATILITGGSSYLDSHQDTRFDVDVSALPHDVCIDLDDDNVSEAEASIFANLASVSDSDLRILSGDSAASVLVRDNEIPLITMTTSATLAPEGGTVAVNFTRTGNILQEFTIQASNFGYWYTLPGIDIDVATSSVVFPAGQSSVAVSVPVPEHADYFWGIPFTIKLSTENVDPSAGNAGQAYFVLSATPPAGASGDSTGTSWVMDIEDNDKAELAIIGTDGSSLLTSIEESGGEVCFGVSARGLRWDGESDLTIRYELGITELGNYLVTPVSSIINQLQYRGSGVDHITQRVDCLDIDDDIVSEYDGSITAAFTYISHAGFEVDSTQGSATIDIIDDEEDLVSAVDVELDAPSSSVDEGENATIRVRRWHGGSSQAPVTQPVAVFLKYWFEGDYYDAPPSTTTAVAIIAGDEYADLSVSVPAHDLHVKNWTLQAELVTGSGYLIRNGYDEVEISVSNDVAIQQLGFYGTDLFTSRDRSWVRESEPRRVFKLGRNKSGSRPNPELTVNVQVREAPLSWVSISSGGGVSWGPQNSYGSQPGNARRRGQHTAYPGTRDFQVTFPSGVKQVDIPIEPQDDQLEETASIVQIRVMGGLGYEIISGGEFGETCPGGENFASGCAVDMVPVLNNDKYEHWFQVTPVTPRITEGEDIVFKVERFAIPALHSGLSQPTVSPVCRTSNPQSATQIPVGNIDYRQLLFALSGHESVTDGGISSRTMTIDLPPGAMSAEFRLATVDDNVGEPESTVEFQILNNNNPQDQYQRPYYCIQSGKRTATIAVEDDDGQSRYTVSASPARIAEDAGETDVTVTVTLDTAATEEVTLNPVIAAGDQQPVQANPAAASDFAVIAQTPEPQVTIPVGSTSGTTVVKIRPVSDNFAERDERLSISVNATDGGGIRPATVRILDDDTLGVTISETALDIDEGGSGAYTVVLTSEPTADVTVTPSRSSGDTDVTVSGALTFTPINWNIAQTVTVSAAQDADAIQDSATIGHRVSGGDYEAASASDVSVTVSDDDAASTEIELTVSTDSVSESAGATNITVTASLNGNALAAGTVVTVSIGDSGDDAVSGTDYATVSDFLVTIGTGLTTGATTFELTPTNDTIDEPDEAFSIEGSVTGFTVTGAAVTITDDDASPAVTLSLSDASISEDGGIATVTASLDHGSSVATTVTVSVAPDTPATSSDYSLSTNRVLTIAAESTASTGTVTITGVDNDIDAADMTVQVKGAAVNSLDVTAPSDVELTLEDDDTRGVTVSATSLDVDEGDDATYTVVLTSQPTADVTVTPSRISGDTHVLVSGALTFTALNWSTAQTVTVSAAQDVRCAGRRGGDRPRGKWRRLRRCDGGIGRCGGG